MEQLNWLDAVEDQVISVFILNPGTLNIMNA